MTAITKGRLKKGNFVVISSPSGGGKNSVIERLLRLDDHYIYSISATTRTPRGSESDGRPYWFLSLAEFQRRIAAGEFIEWEQVYDDYYGTPRQFAEEQANLGRIVLFDLDVKGALKLKGLRPETILIFLQPPSLQILEERLRQRGTDSECEIRERMKLAHWECEQAAKFDHVVLNDSLPETVKAVDQIIRYQTEENKR